MQTSMQGKLTGISKWEIADTGASGAFMYLQQPSSGRNPNVIGQEIIKLTLPVEKFEEYRKFEPEFNKSSTFHVDVDIESGGGDKPKLTVTEIRLISQDKK